MDINFSVIVLTLNRPKDILACLDSLYKQTYTPYEIIVVDQNHGPESRLAITTHFPGVQLINTGKNLGVPAGRNIGINKALGNYLVFLDDDGVLDFRALENATKEIVKNQDVGVYSGKIIDHLTNKLQTGYWPYSKYQLSQADKRFETYTFSGGLHIISRSALERVGNYDEVLFFNLEEKALSLRLINKGYKIVYCPEIVLTHKGKARDGWDSLRFYYYVRAQLLITFIYYPTSELIKYLCIYCIYYFMTSLTNSFFGSYVKALIASLSILKSVKRNPISNIAIKYFIAIEKKQRGPFYYQLITDFNKKRRC
jgi:GT2 family glycosyltransferase